MQRKATKQSRGANADEKRFQGWLKEQSCCVTDAWGVQVHHCVGSSAKHNKVHIGHWFCIPLAPHIHDEYHAGSKAWREIYGTQAYYWDLLADIYYCETGQKVPDDIYAAITDWNK